MNTTLLPRPSPPDRVGRVLARLLQAARDRRARGMAARSALAHGPGTVATVDCTTFIRIWVDAGALRPGSSDGIHLADNHSDRGSRHQGTPMLSTCVPRGSRICWEIFNISPESDAILRIDAISAPALFAQGASPRPAPDNGDAHTAIAARAGDDRYAIAFTVTRPGHAPMRLRITPSLRVVALRSLELQA